MLAHSHFATGSFGQKARRQVPLEAVHLFLLMTFSVASFGSHPQGDYLIRKGVDPFFYTAFLLVFLGESSASP